jgi:anti-sigma factor RsiW
MNTDNHLSEREEIESLLPWFAAGTLSRPEAERIEKAIAADPKLASAYAAVREELTETIRLNETLGAPSARAMQQLFAKIDAESPAVRRSSLAVTLTVRISDFVASLTPRTLAYGAAAAALAIVLQAGVIAGVLLREAAAPEGYRTVAVERAGPAAGSFALVRFAPNASAADITKFLEDNKATVVGGPTAGGLYRLRLAATKLSGDELARAVNRLQDNRIIGFAAAAD